MAPNPTRTTAFRRRILVALSALSLAGFSATSARATEEADSEFQPPSPLSEYLPAAPGEPPVDFCSEWNPEFGYRGYRCCSNTITRSMASARSRGRRRMNSCAPNRIKYQFCDERTAAQKEYVDNVKSGKVDALENIAKTMGSKGGQAFCGPSNGFLVEGRPLVPTAANRIEIRNEARCSNFGTDPMIGAMEWMGREIKKEYHEPEFDQARLIVGDISAPRGGCIAGRAGRRAHKSHTGGTDIDFAYFNPYAGHAPEERFTRTFYVASNWWMLKKLFKNPFACVKVVFVDKSHIRALERYAKTDPEWSKLRPYLRHIRGHRDHFHMRVGSGPGAPGCASDPDMEEAEDLGDEEGTVAKNPAEDLQDEGGDATDEVVGAPSFASLEDAAKNAEEVDPPIRKKGVASVIAPATAQAATDESTATGADRSLASGVDIAQTTLPPHKLEPAITQKYAEKRRRRTASHRTKRKHRR
ncbi:MAG: penicillin-insensitive murein endopeptidase [Bdellovibrionales bacterium]|nr:penicillin-insensitive murein endopeptidase [Bdellovibrionales bacterium]